MTLADHKGQNANLQIHPMTEKPKIVRWLHLDFSGSSFFGFWPLAFGI
jgi:hypothetical protein